VDHSVVTHRSDFDAGSVQLAARRFAFVAQNVALCELISAGGNPLADSQSLRCVYDGMIHDFGLLNGLAGEPAVFVLCLSMQPRAEETSETDGDKRTASA